MIPKINEDHRGIFVELVKNLSFEPKQISYLTINKGCFRGNHYHKKTKEAFILLEGDCELLSHPSRKNGSMFFFNGIKSILERFSLMVVDPGSQHILFSKNGAKLVVLSSQVFNPEDPDTYIYD